MKIRFYCDILVPYYLPKGQTLNLCATTMPYQGKVPEGFKRVCFDADFPPGFITEGILIPSTPAVEVPPVD
jgi:hypothetical protein